MLIISGADDAPEISDREIKILLEGYKEKGSISLRDAVQRAAEAHELSRSEVYRLALKVWKDGR